MELAQALAPNFLLRAHESTTHGGDDSGGYAGAGDPGLVASSSNNVMKSNVESVDSDGMMMRDGRGTTMDEGDGKMVAMKEKGIMAAMRVMMMETESPPSSTGSTTTRSSGDKTDLPEDDLNDIFGLGEPESSDQKVVGNATTMTTTETTT